MNKPKPFDILKQMNKTVYALQLAGYLQRQPGWQREPRKHPAYSLWMIARGEGKMVINGVLHHALPGKLFAISPGDIVEQHTSSEQSMEYYFVRYSFTSTFFENDHWKIHETPEEPYYLHGVYTIANPPEVLNIFEQLYHLWQRRGQLVSFRRRMLFQELLLAIVLDLRAQNVAGNTTLAIERTIDYMVANYKRTLSLEELSQMAGLSVSHYSRLFKKYAGYSPIDYLTHLRMDRAKELLALSDYRLKAVAQSVGYQDELYFSRIFKKVVGQSPSEFAKKHKIKRASLD